MKFCFVIRSFDHQGPSFSTIHLAFEALQRGHEVFFTTLEKISLLSDRRVVGIGLSFSADNPPADREQLTSLLRSNQNHEELNLEKADGVLLRFTHGGFLAPHTSWTYGTLALLNTLEQTLFWNHPQALLESGSKVYHSLVPKEAQVKSLISSHPDLIRDFILSLPQQRAVLKPLYGYGGYQVHRVEGTDERVLLPLLETLTKGGPVLIQKYLEEAPLLDRRVLMVRGEVITLAGQPSVYCRKAREGDFRSNIHAGATAEAASLTPSQTRLLSRMGPELRRKGLNFVGVDLVADKVLELNVYCPGGIHNMNLLYGFNLGESVIQTLEASVLEKRVPSSGPVGAPSLSDEPLVNDARTRL